MTADIPLGHHSDGTTVTINLTDATPLFVTYPDKKQWHALLGSVGTALGKRSDIRWLMCLDKKSMDAWIAENNRPALLERFITDEPESGDLIGRKPFLKSMMKAFRDRSVKKKSGRPMICICIIDDIWDLIRKTDRSDAQKLVRILRAPQISGLKMIAGSSAGHRTLFPELLLPRDQPGHQRPVNEQPASIPACPGTELILGTEGLIFKTSPGGHQWEKWYAPATWTSAAEPGPHMLPPPGSMHPAAVDTDKYPSSPADESLPENARMFTLDN